MPQYLDGKTPVYIGLRADDITIAPDEVKNSKTTVKVKISHTEELGTETLVYGDIDMTRDTFGESPTQIILKAAGFKNFQSGDIADAALNMDNLHLFDMDTEESILPRIPKYDYLECTVSGSVLTAAGVSIPLPDAIKCADSEYELLLPTDAIIVGGDIDAEVLSCEQIDDKSHSMLSFGNSQIFALIDEKQGEKIKISIDLKKITLRKDGQNVVSPMPLVNSITGTFAMDKVKAQTPDGKTKKVTEYSFVIGGQKFAAPKDVAQKMFAALSGRKVFNTTFKYQFTPYDFAVSQSGLPAEVVCMLDYGREKFVKCNVCGNDFYVLADRSYSGNIYLAPDFEKIGVTEMSREIKIV